VKPLVSVVVPVFNGMPHLPNLTKSLLAQTYPNLDIVFSEGGSNDGSREYLETLQDERIRLVYAPANSGAAGNWTFASEQARGEFTKLICQDDLLFPEAIEQQVGDLLAHPSAVMGTATRDIVDANGRTVFNNRGLSGTKGTTIPGSDLLRACYLQGTNVIGEPLAVLFRTDVLKANLPWLDDNPLMLDMSMYTKVAPLGDVVTRRTSVGAFRVSSGSWSTRLAGAQLEQTKRWQREFETIPGTALSPIDRTRANLGRHVQTNLRRLAYRTLRLRGRLDQTPPQGSETTPRQFIGRIPYTVLPFETAVDAILAATNTLGQGRDRPGCAVHFAPAFNVALARDDHSYAQLMADADYVFSDGVPITWVGKRLRPDLAATWDRVYGPDVMEAVFARSDSTGPRHFLLGSTPEVLQKLTRQLTTLFPDALIVGTDSPPFREPTAAELAERDDRIRTSGATIVWVGLGTPLQDFEVARLAATLPVVAVAVGAAFDFLAGTKPQAPAWMQRSGLEWTFRLASEPKRLGKRYVWGNTIFLQEALTSLRSGRSKR